MRIGPVLAAMALALSADDGVERPGPGMAPTAFRIWHAGPNSTDMGEHLFTEQSARLLMTAQAVRGNLYSIDVDHMSLDEGSPPHNHKAVGWHRLEVRQSEAGPELWAVDVEWEQTVRAGIEKTPPEWRYFSPAYGVDKKTNEITSYLNTALTNNPATWNVTALATKLVAASKGLGKMNYQDIAAALFGEDEEKKKEARECVKRMSEAERKAFEAVKKAAFAEDEGGGDGKSEEEKKEEEARAAKAKEEEEATRKANEEKEREEAKRAASAKAATEREVQLATRVDALEATLKERDARDQAAALERERETLFAKRPDIGTELRATLSKLSLEDLKKAIASFPRVTASSDSSANALRVGGAVSGGERDGGRSSSSYVPRLDPSERRILASLRPPTKSVFRATRRGSSVIMPERHGTSEERKARITELEKELETIYAERE